MASMRALAICQGVSVLVAFVSISPFSAMAVSDRESAGLIGPVKTVISISNTESGTVKQRWEWIFDENGVRVGLKSAVDLPQGASPSRIERAETKIVTNSKIEEQVMDEKGNLLKRFVTVLDTRGRMLERVEYSPDAAVLTKTVVQYENDTRKTISFYSMGELLYQRVDALNGLGQVMESHKHRADGTLESHDQFIRNRDGKILEERSFAENGELARRATYTYDARGNEEEQVVWDSHNSLISKRISTYEYDAIGNWIKQDIRVSSAEMGKLVSGAHDITKRTILYYSK
jgi:hypothetical protein